MTIGLYRAQLQPLLIVATDRAVRDDRIATALFDFCQLP
jgi:hypothetical protein